ncbi:TPA: Vir protein [Legionella pneumophila]
MEFIIITQRELSALCGLPYIQQLTYIQGIKPYIDYKTGFVGIRRGISYQSLSEALYIEPHSGIKSGSPSKDQLRRALKGLEKAGLLSIQSWERKLVLRCLLHDRDNSFQNKAAINPLDDTALSKHEDTGVSSTKNKKRDVEANTEKTSDPAIPQDNNNYFFISLSQAFETFWDQYPVKKEKEKAFDEFKKLKPTQQLLRDLLSSLNAQIELYQQQSSEGIWLPAWKFPANWLAQRCWEYQTPTHTEKEYIHAAHERTTENKSSSSQFANTQSSKNAGFSDSEFQKLWKIH